MGVSVDDESKNGTFAKECGFSYPLLCDTSLAIATAFGAANGAKASRMAVLIDRDGNVAQLWPNVDARAFPQECLSGLPEAPPPPEPYCKPTGGINLDKIKPPVAMQCASCGFKWSTEAYDKPKCPKCLAPIGSLD